MRNKNFKNISTYEGWQKQYQKAINSNKYAYKQYRLKKDIYHQFCQLVPKATIKKHQAQIDATINHLLWYSAYDGIDILLFMSYSLLTSDEDHHFNSLKRLQQAYERGQNHNVNFKKKQSYLNTHDTVAGYDYYMLNTDLMLDLLWNYQGVRRLITTWLNGYLKIKRIYGAEAMESFLDDATSQNYFVHLLTGTKSDANHITLSRYKRFEKHTLTKQAWRFEVKANIDILGTFWD